MKINEVIRKYRKEQNLTQEQVANYLGVSAPAVNKWENGISYPDITLLAPLARVLKTDVDTLLSFREELTDIEIDQIVREISAEITTEGYEKTFEKVSGLIKEYPACDKLRLLAGQILNSYLPSQEIENKEKYKKQLIAWFETVAYSPEKELASMATISLSQNYMQSGEYDKAQKLLDGIPPMGFDKRVMQASLYSRQEKYAEAFRIHEEMLYQNANCIIGSLMQMIELLCRQEKYEQAMEYAKLSRSVAMEFELGSYITGTAEFMVAVSKRDKAESLRLLEEMVSGMDKIYQIRESRLYQHMKFKPDDGLVEMRQMVKRSLEQDQELEFIRTEPEFLRLIERL